MHKNNFNRLKLTVFTITFILKMFEGACVCVWCECVCMYMCECAPARVCVTVDSENWTLRSAQLLTSYRVSTDFL